LLLEITDVHSLGLKDAQGLIVTDAFYCDRDDETRAFSKKFLEKVGHMPTMIQAGLYSATMHYLKAIETTGTDDTAKVMTQMKATPINDFFTHNGHIREDGRMVHDMYLFEVKKPEESKGEWDLYKLLATVPADQAFRPLDKGGCPLVKTN
jgi:branched-chain amino acid transport system substrate-binding protein